MSGRHLSFVVLAFGFIFGYRDLPFVGAEVKLASFSEFVTENASLELTCTTGTQIVQAFSLSVGSQLQGSLLSDCSVLAKAPDPALYQFTCPTNRQLKWTIKRITRANEGDIWECHVYIPGGTETANYYVSVYVPIQSVTMTSPTGNMVTVQENTEIVFLCTTSGGLPAPSVRWYKDQRTPTTSDDVDITASASITTSKTNDDLVSVTSTLKYSPLKVDNGVKIYCTANNSDSTLTSTRQPQLNVQYSPDSLPKIENLDNGDSYKVLENRPGTLSCSIQGGNPLATLSWNCYNRGLASSIDGNTVRKNVTWTATRNQDRSCTCQSSHVIAGNQNVSVRVETLYGPDEPVFKVSDRNVFRSVSFIEGKTQSVVCEGKGNPTANVYRWMKGENNVSLYTNIDI